MASAQLSQGCLDIVSASLDITCLNWPALVKGLSAKPQALCQCQQAAVCPHRCHAWLSSCSPSPSSCKPRARNMFLPHWSPALWPAWGMRKAALPCSAPKADPSLRSSVSPSGLLCLNILLLSPQWGWFLLDNKIFRSKQTKLTNVQWMCCTLTRAPSLWCGLD